MDANEREYSSEAGQGALESGRDGPPGRPPLSLFAARPAVAPYRRKYRFEFPASET